MKRDWVFAVALCTASCSDNLPVSGSGAQRVNAEALYTTQDGHMGFGVDDKQIVHQSPIYGQTASDISVKTLPIYAQLISRPSSRVRCLTMEHIAFAVPDVPAINTAFSCYGIVFRIVECSDLDCTSFGVIADCKSFDSGHCSPKVDRSGQSSLQYYYKFESGKGITKIDWSPTQSNAGSILILRRGRGLLHQL
jgi:hypothetical protein